MPNLLIVAGENSASALASALIIPDIDMLRTVRTGNEALREISSELFNIAVVMEESPDELALKIVSEAVYAGLYVLFIVSRKRFDTFNRKAVGGNLILMPRPLKKQLFSQTVELLCAFAGAYNCSRIKDPPDADTSVDRAKQLLMDTLEMTEPDAHRIIQKVGMDTRIGKVKTAGLILTYLGQSVI